MADRARIIPVNQHRQDVMVADRQRLIADAEFQWRQVAVGVALELLRGRIAQVAPRYAALQGNARLRQFVLDLADAAMPGADRATVEHKLFQHAATTERIWPDNPIECLPDGTLLLPPDAPITVRHVMQALEHRRSLRPPRPRGRPRRPGKTAG